MSNEMFKGFGKYLEYLARIDRVSTYWTAL